MDEANAEKNPWVELDETIEDAVESIACLTDYLQSEPEVAERAATALRKVGRRAIRPLAAALRLSRSPDHKLRILGLLLLLGPETRVRVGRVMRKVLRTEKDQQVRVSASMALTQLLIWESRGT
jgi:hypothetical protein